MHLSLKFAFLFLSAQVSVRPAYSQQNAGEFKCDLMRFEVKRLTVISLCIDRVQIQPGHKFPRLSPSHSR